MLIAKDFPMTEVKSDFLISRIVERLAEQLVREKGFSIDKAFATIYSSSTFSALDDKKSGLFEQSPDYVFDRLEKELEREC